MPLPRRRRGDCSPITQRMASTTFDLPQPFGPTTAVMPSRNSRVVRSTKDLKPKSSRDLRRKRGPSRPGRTRPQGSLGRTSAGLDSRRTNRGVGEVYHPSRGRRKAVRRLPPRRPARPRGSTSTAPPRGDPRAGGPATDATAPVGSRPGTPGEGARRRSGPVDGALEAYQAALALDPGHVGALARAAHWGLAREPERGRAFLERAAALAPDAAGIRADLARLALADGRR